MTNLVWSNLWRHYSSYIIYAVIAIGALEQYVPAIQGSIPPWALIVIGMCGALVKVIPQPRPEDTK